MGDYHTGDPDQMCCGARVADVVLAIRDLEPGFHTVAEVQRRYRELPGARTVPEKCVSTVVRRFGLLQYRVDGERGWTINPARLAERWPRLPWGPIDPDPDPDWATQTDGQREMAP